MAEPQQKRLREESHNEFVDSNPNSKRQKPHNNILSLLDEEEEEPIHDLSSLFSTLEQELSSSTATFDFDSPPEDDHKTTTADGGEEDDAVKSVIRHLLEASDDELGIPNTDYNHEIKSDDDNFPFEFVDNGLWELEDVAANYYAILQSELFM
ncbi:hypothetical protein ACS0TY_008965 [Phlomoides rotata]